MRSPVSGVVALGLGLALSFALVGIPIMALGAGALLAWAHRDPAAPDGERRALTAGWIAILILGAAVIAGGVLGVACSDLFEEALGDDETAFGTIAILAPLASGLLFAPLAFAPSLALHDSKAAWIVESVWLSAQRGALGTMTIGLVLGAHGALPFALAWGCAELVDDDLAPLALLSGCALTVVMAPVSLSLLAGAFARARQRAAEPRHAERALGALGGLALGPVVVVAAVLGVAIAAPSPLRATEHVAGRETPIWIEGTALRIEAEWRSVRVVDETDGEVRQYPVDAFLWAPTARAERVRYQGRSAWLVRIADDSRAFGLVLDDEGHRLDDGVGRRFDARVPPLALGLLALACLLGVLFAVHAGRVRAWVRTLALVIEGADRGLEILPAILALRGSSPSVTRERTLVGASGAVLEIDGGAIRVALSDAPLQVLAIDPEVPAQIPDGARATLVSRGARLAGVGLREAAARLPPGTALVIGDPVRGRSALVRAAFPPLVRAGLGIGALVVAAAVAIGMATS